MKAIIISLGLIVRLSCFGQADTTFTKGVKGFLFLTGYNLNYDENNSEVRSWGFSDYFFPCDSFNEKDFIDTNKCIKFTDGLRMEIFKNRNMLRDKAMKFQCEYKDCYPYGFFYILPVTIDYKLFKDDWSPYCEGKSFDENVLKGSKLKFYRQEGVAILPTKISLIQSNKKTYTIF